MTAVYFSATATFSAPINRDFWRKIREDPHPFVSLVAVGGTTGGYFRGVVYLNVPQKVRKKALRYEITSLLVTKVESLSRVGVTQLLFDEVTVGVL